MNHPDDPQHRIWLQDEALRLLGWARGAAHPAGGFGWRSATGELILDRGRPLWVNCRMVHCLALGQLAGLSSDHDLLADGIAVLDSSFRDRDYGGWYANADEPENGVKETYGHAFVILASATATIAEVPGARDLLDDALDTTLTRLWDPSTDMPVDSTDRTFAAVDAYRGGNSSMHLVEALLAASDATGSTEYLERAHRIAQVLLPKAKAIGWRMPEHYDSAWQVDHDYNRDRPSDPFRPYGVTPGHGLEWARLLLLLDGLMDHTDGQLSIAAEGLARTAIDDAWDTEIGGFAYTTDFDGVPVVRERFHWVPCEAIGACWALWRTTGDPYWAACYSAVWAWTQELLIDPAHPGGWRHELSATNDRVATTWPDRPDVYHALQAVLCPPLDPTPGLALSLARRTHSSPRLVSRVGNGESGSLDPP